MGSTLIDGLGMIAWAIILGCVGLLLLGEYRKVFLEHPKTVITFEIWSQIVAKAGGPGYLACMMLFCSAIFLIGGIATIVSAGHEAVYRFVIQAMTRNT